VAVLAILLFAKSALAFERLVDVGEVGAVGALMPILSVAFVEATLDASEPQPARQRPVLAPESPLPALAASRPRSESNAKPGAGDAAGTSDTVIMPGAPGKRFDDRAQARLAAARELVSRCTGAVHPARGPPIDPRS